MADPIPTKIEEVLIRPLADVLGRIGEGVAAAQRAMDLNSIATQTLIENDPVLHEFGLEATWYHMPEVELELKMALTLHREDVVRNQRVVRRKHRMYAAPLNASYRNTFDADVSGASLIKAKIASVPPPTRITPES